jgi:hypothetical protein
MRKYLFRDSSGSFPFWTLLGDRIHIVRHEAGIVTWSAAVYCLGRCVAFITCRPWLVRFRSQENTRGLSVHLHVGRWGVSLLLGDNRTSLMESIRERIVEVTNG